MTCRSLCYGPSSGAEAKNQQHTLYSGRQMYARHQWEAVLVTQTCKGITSCLSKWNSAPKLPKPSVKILLLISSLLPRYYLAQ